MPARVVKKIGLRMHCTPILKDEIFSACICLGSVVMRFLFFVSRASGHVERFADLMVKDTKNGQCFRADHLLEAHLEKLCDSKKTTAEDKEKMQQIMNQVKTFFKRNKLGWFYILAIKRKGRILLILLLLLL